ncbi:MAG: Ig-like domain-containing protein, partial [Sulfurimonas sp.]|uniref:cadherin-like domain-containing protein n=1 Tax=Sulfurimonas sp. TaxID=2022749 RepID=UPI0025DC622C
MAQIIGTIGEANGKFFAKDAQGNLRELEVGDEIYAGESVVPDAKNQTNATISIVPRTAGETIVLNSSGEQLLDETLLNVGLDNEEVAFEPDTLNEALALNDLDPADESTYDEVPYTQEPLIIESDRSQNDKVAKSKDSQSMVSLRDGDSTDIVSDLRKAEWNDGNKEPIFRGDIEFEESLDAGLLNTQRVEPVQTNDVPVAVDDARVIVKEGGNSVTGQVLTNDIPGRDGLTTGKELKEFTYNSVIRTFDDANPTYTINGTTLGDLTVNRDGTWELDPTGITIATHTEDSFTYKIVDSDGDISNSAKQPLIMFDADVATSIVTTTTEDTNKLLVLNDTSGDVKIKDTSSTSEKTLAKNESINITRADGEVVGKITNNGDGTVTFTPSKHYCGEDAEFSYEVTRSDNTTIVNDSVKITVTPVAENKTTDTNGDAHYDVITQGDKNYGTITESSSYGYISLSALSVTNEDDRGNTTNPFASEITTVKLSGVPVGFRFKYHDGTTDHEFTVADVNVGVTIPFEYISTLEVKPTNFFAGEIKIAMQVITVDCEGGAPAQQDTSISLPDYLVINVTNVANGIEALNAAQATGFEDAGRANGNTSKDSNSGDITNPQNGINLNITATTTDTSGRETVTAMIDKIPDGGAIYYSDTNGTITIDKDGVVSGTNPNVTVLLNNADDTWKINIEDFKNTAPLKFIPPHNSNEDYSFEVTAFTRDGKSYSSTTDPKTITVTVDGVADIPVHDDFKKLDADEVVNADISKNIYSDVVIEDNSNTRSGATISFAELYKEPGVASYDDDSEKLSIVITGLATGFSVQDAAGVSFNGKSAAAREWSFDVDKIDDIVIQTPKNF